MFREPHLILIDIDGTLTDGQSNRPPEENLSAIRRARQLGHKIVINTGRAYANLHPDLMEVMDEFDGVCCANGSYIRHKDDIIRDCHFNDYILYEMVKYTLQKNNRFCLFEGDEVVLKVTESSPIYGTFGTRIFDADEIGTTYKGKSFHVMSCEGQLDPEFVSAFENDTNIFQCHTYADITPPGCSKAIAVQIMAEYYKISLDRTVSIGDSANDLPMFNTSAFSVAMQNAPDDIKNSADYVTTSNNQFGVARAIEKLFLTHISE